MVENVLRMPRVQTFFTIFAVGMNIQKDSPFNKMEIYKAEL